MNNYTIKNSPQGTKAWMDDRAGHMTASHAQAIGNCGKGLNTYIYELMANSYSSGERDSYTSADMQRGIDLEKQARTMYELRTGDEVEEVGFVEMDEYVGASPDGLIGEHGGIEIKCLNDINHFKLILKGEKGIESKYLWQIQMNMLITERKHWMYVSYNPNYKKSLLIYRIEPDKEKHEKLIEGIEKGKHLIKEICQKYKK